MSFEEDASSLMGKYITESEMVAVVIYKKGCKKTWLKQGPLKKTCV
jgi:hypothetical protein